MKKDLRKSLAALTLASLLGAGGCAGMQERVALPKLSLPSPWSTVKNAPAKTSSSDEAAPAPMKSAAEVKATAKSTSKDKMSKDDESTAMAMLRGLNHERSGEWDKARRVYQEIREKQPDSVEALHRLGIVADAQKRHAEAEGLFLMALERVPRNAALLADLGYCYFLQGQLTKAESALRKATTLEPTNQRYSNNLGLVTGHLGRHQEALEHFRKGGSEADAQYNLAFVYAAQERTKEAKACFQAALANDPTHRRAREALSSFEEYDRMPAYLRDMHDVADNGVKYVPYIEGSQANDVAQAGGASTSYNASRVARTLHAEAQGLRGRNMASQRVDESAGR